MLVCVTGPATDADEWAAFEDACLDLLSHDRRMRVMALADDTGLTEYQALLVTVLGESIARTAEIEF